MRPILKNIQVKWYSVALIVAAILGALAQTPLSEPVSGFYKHFQHSLVASAGFSFLRMFSAFSLALVFAICFGVLAATSRARARVILPVIDILQSVPLLGFFPTAIFWFMKLGSPGLGLELAVVFLIFTSQAWNLVFAVYDGIRSIPESTKQAVEAMSLGPVARFHRLYLPAAFPRIVDNAALSWSNGWYFLMACEIISMGPLKFEVAGLGSLMFRAVDEGQWASFYLGLAALFAIVFVMDLFLWKPLHALASGYRFESSDRDPAEISVSAEVVLGFYRNSVLTAPLRWTLALSEKLFLSLERIFDQKYTPETKHKRSTWTWVDAAISGLFWIGVLVGLIWSSQAIYELFASPQTLRAPQILSSIFSSGLRIVIAYSLCLFWILPLCFWLHTHRKYLRWAQSSAQILASIPATAFFPAIAVLSFQVFETTELAVVLMLVTGMQWYLLFNVLGGAQNVGQEMRDLGRALGLSRWQYFKSIFLPAIAPALITGSITAVGGGWNALIIAEYIRIGDLLYQVFGIGAVISSATFEAGDRNLVAYALFFMVSVIVTLNKLFWQPLYNWAENKFRLGNS